jgi:hypothetical protein
MINTQQVISCPHCGGTLVIEQINCNVFRHGVYKNNGEQINPHLSKNECDRLSKYNLIYGCGKPFTTVHKDNNIIAEVCDYI